MKSGKFLTGPVIVLIFQVQLEVFHSVDYWDNSYSISCWQAKEKSWKMERKMYYFTGIVIVLNFQIQLG